VEVDVKVAVPRFDQAIAPCFEAAGHFLIATVENGKVVSAEVAHCAGPEGYRRVRLLQIHRADMVVCNGIKGCYRDMLAGSGVTVIANVTGLADEALNRLAGGELSPELTARDEVANYPAIPHQELVARARTLFENGGYTVTAGPEQASFLVDLLAETKCPVCSRPVRVAICCGAHTYRPTQEIVEFHHATPSGYDARVYFCPASPAASQCCQEYGIELIEPDMPGMELKQKPANKLPILRGRVAGHERASWV
jgi:predicted Fe-Mo cluster-binding NifX family protein